jgi:hypothetical protein
MPHNFMENWRQIWKWKAVCILAGWLGWLGATPAMAQVGGSESFAFLHLPLNPTQVARGGIQVAGKALATTDFMQNPALLDSACHRQVSVSFMPFVSDIQSGTAAYSHLYKGLRLAYGAQYVNYGTLQQTDELGRVLGTFQASDVAIQAGVSQQIGVFTAGVTLRWVNARMEQYGASAMLVDMGGIFRHPTQDFSIGLVLKNVGFVTSPWVAGQPLVLPLDLQLGFEFKPQYMPVRFSLTARQLHRPDIAYFDPRVRRLDLNGNNITQPPGTVDGIARHLIGSMTLVLHRQFQTFLGYNHLINRELILQNGGGLAGFSSGFLFKTKKIDFSFGWTSYHAAGGIIAWGLNYRL